MLKTLLYSDAVGLAASVGLLLMRLTVGAAFVLHGWPKAQNPLGWMGPDTPGVLQLLAAVGEFGGGIAVLLGFLTRLGALGIAGTMVGAMVLFHIPKGNPFVGGPGQASWELVAVYFACAVMFILVGPGRFSVDAYAFAKRPWWKVWG